MSNDTQHRDRANGQYAHADFDRLCRCGHTLGVHTADRVAGVQECLNCDIGDGTPCDCQSFRPAPKKRR